MTERVLDLDFQNVLEFAVSRSEMSVIHSYCSTSLTTNPELDLGTHLAQYSMILQQAA